MMNKKFIFCGVFVLGLAAMTFGEDAHNGFFSGFLSLKSNVQNETFKNALNERTSRINELIAIVNREDNGFTGPTNADPFVSDPRELAADLLGTYRASEAVGALTDHLTYLPPPPRIDFHSDKPTPYYYSCAAALVRIGEPSDTVSRMVWEIKTSEDNTAIKLASWVILTIKGKDSALKILADPAEEILGKTRPGIASAIDYIKSDKYGRGYPGREESRSLKPVLRPNLNQP